MKRDQICGGIGIVCDGFTVMNWYWTGRPVTAADTPFAWMYVTGALAGAAAAAFGPGPLPCNRP